MDKDSRISILRREQTIGPWQSERDLGKLLLGERNGMVIELWEFPYKLSTKIHLFDLTTPFRP